MRYLATSGNNQIHVSLAGTMFTIDDNVPIDAGSGCAPVSGDPTKVTCVAYKEQNGWFKRFSVDAGGGNDSVVHQTTAGAQGAPMSAFGGSEHDEMTGADGVQDALVGGPGNDTLRSGDEFLASRDVLDGGPGNDTLDGGAGLDDLHGGSGTDTLSDGEHGDTLDGGADMAPDVIDGGANSSLGFQWADTVVYDRAQPVTVDLRRTDASQGTPGENDTIQRVENVQGGEGGDLIIGNEHPNTLRGGLGNDRLDGREGVDTINGDDGNDILIGSYFPDGTMDFLDCDGVGGDHDDDPFDTAFRDRLYPDSVKDCEQVFYL